MQYTLDRELKGHCMIFSGPLDLMSETVDAYKTVNPNAMGTVDPRAYDKGRKGHGWDCLKGFIKTPWPEAVSVIASRSLTASLATSTVSRTLARQSG